jgi:hypothetical protein
MQRQKRLILKSLNYAIRVFVVRFRCGLVWTIFSPRLSTPRLKLTDSWNYLPNSQLRWSIINHRLHCEFRNKTFEFHFKFSKKINLSLLYFPSISYLVQTKLFTYHIKMGIIILKNTDNLMHNVKIVLLILIAYKKACNWSIFLVIYH